MIWGWATRISANTYVRKVCLRVRCGSKRGYPLGIGKTVFVETCCVDFGSCFERAVLQTVLQMALSARCILLIIQQSFAVWDEGRRAQMRFVRKMCKGVQNGC